VQLALGPAIAALAAGNRVMLKPSEVTPATSALLAEAVAQRFAADEFTVVTGGADVGAGVRAPAVRPPVLHRLDRGRPPGRDGGGRNLVPVTLELGGKSPAIVDASADLALVAPRLAVGKLLNAGQTCIAPDYALVPRRACRSRWSREARPSATSTPTRCAATTTRRSSTRGITRDWSR
jgi:coniferyl-aldehyde dehydrogenase